MIKYIICNEEFTSLVAGKEHSVEKHGSFKLKDTEEYKDHDFGLMGNHEPDTCTVCLLQNL